MFFLKLRKNIRKKMKFEDVADEWLEYKKNSIKESTYYEYLEIIEHKLKPEFKEKNIESINDLNNFIQKLSKCYKPKTIRGIVTVLKTIFRYYEEEYDCNIKVKRIELPKTNKGKVEIFTKRETSRLKNYYAKTNDEKAIGILISLYAGLRIGEICALQWKDIDFADRKIHITKTAERVSNVITKKSKIMVSTPKTQTSERNIPISTKLYDILKNSKNKENYYVLSGTEKVMEPRAYQNIYNNILRKNRIKHRKFHCLRHTFASNCIEVGMDAKSLSEILGHANVSTTLSIYVHSSDQIKKRYLEKL